MDFGLAGKTAIVTGGSSMIGRAITLAFAQEGANVVIAARGMEDAEKVANEANALGRGGRTIAVATDVIKLDQVLAMAKKAADEFKHIDVLVNNVGWDKIMMFTDTTPELWAEIIDINYKSVLNCLKAVLPYMIQQKGGAIVSIGSDAGRVGGFREAVYAGCKAAVSGISMAVVREVGRYGIRLNVVCPGVTPPSSPEEVGQRSGWKGVLFTPEQIETMAKSVPLRRLGKPSDIANMVVFLASDAGAYVNGQTISVDGGSVMA